MRKTGATTSFSSLSLGLAKRPNVIFSFIFSFILLHLDAYFWPFWPSCPSKNTVCGVANSITSTQHHPFFAHHIFILFQFQRQNFIVFYSIIIYSLFSLVILKKKIQQNVCFLGTHVFFCTIPYHDYIIFTLF